MPRQVSVTVVSTRKLVMRVYVIPFLIIVSLFIIFIGWAAIPVHMPYVGLKRTAGNLGHIKIRYYLNPYNDTDVMMDEHADCRLLDRSPYHVQGDSTTNYYNVNCDGRVGYVEESNLRW